MSEPEPFYLAMGWEKDLWLLPTREVTLATAMTIMVSAVFAIKLGNHNKETQVLSGQASGSHILQPDLEVSQLTTDLS